MYLQANQHEATGRSWFAAGRRVAESILVDEDTTRVCLCVCDQALRGPFDVKCVRPTLNHTQG